jgi:hypothetical protein
MVTTTTGIGYNIAYKTSDQNPNNGDNVNNNK